MARLLGLSRGEANQSPREITRTVPTSESGENGWLLRFFDSAFFCEWIAVSYLYKHEHSGVRDYLCNRMYALPLSGVESYLLQICYMLIHKPSPSLDKFLIDMCSKSLQMALKVHWFLMAELEESDDNEGIGRIQEKCQIAATLMGEWPTLVSLPSKDASSSPSGKNLMLNRLFSSKQKLLSLSSSPPIQRSISFATPSVKGCEHEDGVRSSLDENKILKKFIPGQKVRDALLFRKSAEKDEDDAEKDGFFKRLLRDSRDENEELSSSSEGFLRRFFRDSKNDFEEKSLSRSTEDEEKEGFFRKFFKEKSDDRREGTDRNTNDVKVGVEDKGSKGSEDDKDGFLRKFFKERFEDKKSVNDRRDEEHREAAVSGVAVEEESSEFSLFRKLFRVHPDDTKNAMSNQTGDGAFLESSPGTENFFRKLFRDRDRSVEDSELFGSKKQNEKFPCSLKPDQKLNIKPPRPSNSPSQLRKGAYHESLDFVQSLCETSCGLVDIVPIEDRKSALRESLADINSHVADTQNNGGICFPMGKKTHRVVHIPEDEAVLLNSREKAPYLICIEVVKAETPSNAKEKLGHQKSRRGGIPLSNGDVRLAKTPPWAYPLCNSHDSHPGGSERISKSASQAIDQAMTHSWDAKVKFVNVDVSLETISPTHSNSMGYGCGDQNIVPEPEGLTSRVFGDGVDATHRSEMEGDSETEWVKVSLTADPRVRMDDIEDEGTPRRKEHRRIPSTIAMEEVKAAAAKGEAPAGLHLKGAGQESSDSLPKIANGGIPKPTDALSGELWNSKKERIRSASAYGKLPGWDLFSIIVKSGDDCRQEHLAVQLISHFYDIFQEAGIPLWLRPYEVIVTSSYTSLIETIPDTASLHSLKGRYPGVTSLRDFFIAKYQEHSPSFKLAQRNFVESMAGYSIVCYLLQVKDRHNGNLLMDEEGHIIHIDFGFMLSNSPGGVNFESAPFKLTRELLEVMDSDADGVPSEFFDYFKVLCIQGFLACRKHAERIILLVEMLQDSGFPCFKGGPRTIQNLRKRFHLSLTEEQCVSLMLSLISSSLDAWRTRQYDYYQRVLNGIL